FVSQRKPQRPLRQKEGKRSVVCWRRPLSWCSMIWAPGRGSGLTKRQLSGQRESWHCRLPKKPGPGSSCRCPRASARAPRRSYFDHLVRASEQRRGDFKTESLRGRNVYDEIKLGRLLDRDIGRFRHAQDLVDKVGGAPEQVREVLGHRTR